MMRNNSTVSKHLKKYYRGSVLESWSMHRLSRRMLIVNRKINLKLRSWQEYQLQHGTREKKRAIIEGRKVEYLRTFMQMFAYIINV